MFRKTKSDASSPNLPASYKKEAIPTIVAHGMHVLGNVVHEDGVVDFSGVLDGNIRCHTLTVRVSGSIKGEITANEVFVYGKIDGLIRAKSVHLYSGCYIEGIVMHEKISIEDGAFLDGKCKRTDKVQSLEPMSGFDDEEESAAAGGSSAKVLDSIRLIR